MADINTLRTRDRYRVVRSALIDSAARPGFRLIEFSVQSNHLHLICEAKDSTTLARGVQGLKIRIARRLNRLLDRSGTVFAERYHRHVLRTPREVRNALAYVLNNARRHAAQHGRRKPRGWIDPCSTARAFFGLEQPTLPAPLSWLLRVGWRRSGPVHVDEVPG